MGWLLNGETILKAKIEWQIKLLSEAGKKKIQQNPLWMNEIRLAEYQQKKHDAVAQMWEEFDDLDE